MRIGVARQREGPGIARPCHNGVAADQGHRNRLRVEERVSTGDHQRSASNGTDALRRDLRPDIASINNFEVVRRRKTYGNRIEFVVNSNGSGAAAAVAAAAVMAAPARNDLNMPETAFLCSVTEGISSILLMLVDTGDRLAVNRLPDPIADRLTVGI